MLPRQSAEALNPWCEWKSWPVCVVVLVV